MYTSTTHMFTTHSCFHPLDSLSLPCLYEKHGPSDSYHRRSTTYHKSSPEKCTAYFSFKGYLLPSSQSRITVNEVTDQYHNIVKHVARCRTISHIAHKPRNEFIFCYFLSKKKKTGCRRVLVKTSAI